MKKTIALFALVLCILAGLVSGSLALYTKDIDIADTGSVIAKKFYLRAAGDPLTYKDDVLIAPTESVIAAFTVSNNDGAATPYTTEVDMDLDITVTIAAADGKTAIPYITARLLDGSNAELGVFVLTDGVGAYTLSVDDAFEANTPATLTYKIKLTWADLGQNGDTDPDNDDISFQGPDFGNKYTVTVTGTQAV